MEHTLPSRINLLPPRHTYRKTSAAHIIPWVLIVITILIPLNNQRVIEDANRGLVLGLTQASKTLDTDTSFNQGSLSSTTVSGSGSSAVVQLTGIGGAPAWWNGGYAYRKQMTITNTTATALSSGYTVSSTFNHASLVSGGKSLASGNDIRIVYWNGVSNIELDRVLDDGSSWNNATTKLWFKSQSEIVGSGIDSNYYLYYSNAAAGSPPINKSNVYALYDDFNEHANNADPEGWREDSGTWYVQDQYYYTSGGSQPVTTSTVIADTTSNYIVQTRAKYASGSYVGLMPRHTGSGATDSGYYMGPNGAGTSVEFWKRTNGNWSQLGSGTALAGFTDGQWHTLKAVVLGSLLEFYFDGTLIKSYTDSSSPWLSGTAALHTTAAGSYDDVLVRLYASSEPTVNQGSEINALAASGNWQSATNGNVLDLVWNGGWGDGTDGSTAFSAVVANISAEATITFSMKTAISTAALIAAPYIELGTVSTGTTYIKTKADLDGLGIGANRYIQVRAVFSQTNGINPQLDSISLSYRADQDSPTNPPANENVTAKNEPDGAVTLTSSMWYNYPTPSFTWTGALDSDSGIAGYYVYFGTNQNADPADPLLGLSLQPTATFTASGLISGQIYYLRIKSVDNAGNKSMATWAPFTYKYESAKPSNPGSLSVMPVGYTSQNSFFFVWSGGGDEENGSGLWGYCYKTGDPDSESIYHSDQCTEETSIDEIPAYQSGENRFYVRSRDNARNVNNSYISVPYYYNTNAPSAPRNVTIAQALTLDGTECLSLDNCYSVSWVLPQTYVGSIASYYYAVNEDAIALSNSVQTIESETIARALSARPLATRQGINTFDIVAKDNSGNVTFDSVSSGRAYFVAETSAPGVPINLQITDSSNREAEAYQLTLTWDEPLLTGSGIDHYSIYRSIDNSTYSQVGTAPATATGYLDTGLASGIRYYYYLTAEDNASAESAESTTVSAVPTGRFTSSPEIIVQPTTTTSILSATVSWKMERTCRGYVELREVSEDSYAEQGAGSDSADQSVTVIGLEADTLYYFRTRCQDIDGNVSLSEEMSFRTSDAPSRPINLIASPAINSENEFSFNWNPPSDWGVTISHYYFSVNEEPTETNSTQINGNSLPAGSYATRQGSNLLYIVAVDSAGNYNLSNYASVAFNADTTAPGIPTNLLITDTSNRATNRYSLTIEWDMSEGEVDHYNLYRSIDNTVFENVSEVRSTIYAETGLDTEKTYSYYVTAVDSAGAESVESETVSKQPTGKYVTPPEYAGDPAVEITSTAATITWITNRASTSFVNYGLTDELGESKGSLEAMFTHSVLLTGLTPSSIYHFKVQSFDEARDYTLEAALSDTFTFETAVAPAISDLKVEDIRQTSALVTWKTTTVSTSTVNYGKTPDYGSSIADQSGSGTTLHTVKLSDLEPDSLYHMRIIGSDSDGNLLQSDDYVFQTLAFPRIFNVTFEPIKDASSMTIKVAWETNVETDSIVEYGIVGGGLSEKVTSDMLVTHELVIANLVDNAIYTFKAKGRDQYGNIATSAEQTYATPFDTRPPKLSDISVETAIIGTGRDAKAQIIIIWKTDENATSQVEYGEGVGGTSYTSKTVEDGILSNSHLVIISDLNPAKPYHFRILTKDGAGNQSVSTDRAVITGRATESVLDIIVVNLQKTFGWLGSIQNIGNIFKSL